MSVDARGGGGWGGNGQCPQFCDFFALMASLTCVTLLSVNMKVLPVSESWKYLLLLSAFQQCAGGGSWCTGTPAAPFLVNAASLSFCLRFSSSESLLLCYYLCIFVVIIQIDTRMDIRMKSEFEFFMQVTLNSKQSLSRLKVYQKLLLQFFKVRLKVRILWLILFMLN